MSCSSCVNKIETSIMKMKGMISANVALTLHAGRFKYDSEVTGPRDIIDELKVSKILNN
jgi:Cu+-exporting ATPase